MFHRVLLAAVAVVVIDAPSAPAQVYYYQSSFFGFQSQRGHFAFGGGYRYAAPVYGYVYFYAPPPPVLLPPRDFREPIAPRRDPFPTVEDYAPARVDAAVKRGDLRVFKPGERIVPIAAAIPLPKPPVEPKALAAFLVQQARESFEREQIGRATERLRAAIALQPKEAKWHFWLAQSHMARGEYAESVLAIRAGMALEPGWPTQPFDWKELYGPRIVALAADIAELKANVSAHQGDGGLQFALGCYEWFSGNRQAALKLFELAKRTYPVECQRFIAAAKK